MRRTITAISSTIKRILLLATVLIVCTATNAQNIDWIKGDEAFAYGGYNEALSCYKKALKKNKTNTELMYKAAMSAQLCNEYQEAIKYYKDLEKTTGGIAAHPDALYHLATMYRYVNMMDSAIVYYNLYLKGNRNTEYKQRAKQEHDACIWVIEQRKNKDTSIVYNIDHIGKQVNTKTNESGAILVDSVMLFTRTQEISKSENREAILPTFILSQIYQSDFNKKGKLTKAEINEWGLNSTKKHSGNMSYDALSKTIFFTLCTTKSDNDNKFLCEIYSSTYNNKKWSDPKKIESDVNIDGYTSTQPSIGYSDGKLILYFVSDRPGGSGGLDIWYAVIDSNKIGKSTNLGYPINTPGNEITPFYSTSNKTLYFSSDWHYGYGGYDIFSSHGGRDQWTMPINLGEPINSSANDLYFAINPPDTSSGFLTSNREGSFFTPGNTCCNDIYSWNIVKDTTCPCRNKRDTIIVPLNLSLQKQARILMPLALYFHNDEPNPRSISTTTSLSYSETYKNYINLKDEYLDIHTKANDTVELKKIQDFFDNKVMYNYDKFETFINILQKDLKEGEKVKLLIKGFASPLHTQEYNYTLSQRRISSFINELRDIDSSYVHFDTDSNCNLQIEELAFGSSNANQNVSNSRTNTRHSIYSTSAALERKIEIIDYRYFNNQQTEVAEINIPQNFTIGDIIKDSVVNISLAFPINLTSEIVIENVITKAENTKITNYTLSQAENKLIIDITINSLNSNTNQRNTIPLEIKINKLTDPILYNIHYNIAK